MKKKFNFNDALEIARMDAQVGVLSAMELLQEKGFNCKYYFSIMNKEKNLNNDDLNLLTRDKQFKKLGIFEIMQRAYQIAWNE